jgi:hypothetical protein
MKRIILAAALAGAFLLPAAPAAHASVSGNLCWTEYPCAPGNSSGVDNSDIDNGNVGTYSVTGDPSYYATFTLLSDGNYDYYKDGDNGLCMTVNNATLVVYPDTCGQYPAAQGWEAISGGRWVNEQTGKCLYAVTTSLAVMAGYCGSGNTNETWVFGDYG